jgi:hypothetical protein
VLRERVLRTECYHRATAAGILWSIVEEAARRWLLALPPQERAWVPHAYCDRSDGWLGMMHEVETLCGAKQTPSFEPF